MARDGGTVATPSESIVEPMTIFPEPRSVLELDPIDHPPHYGGKENVYEAIKVIDAWDLGFCLGNCIKYLCRAGKKEGSRALDDLRKASWYLQHEIERRMSREEGLA